MVDYIELERQTTEDPVIYNQLTKADPQALEKLHNLTLLRTDVDGTTTDVNELRRKCLLDQASGSSRNSRSDGTDTREFLSRLDELPIEMMQNIFEGLHIQTLTNLRSVNRRAMSIVNSLPQYKEIVTHAPDVLRAMLSTKVAQHYELTRLYSELTRGRTGGTIALITDPA